MNLKLLLPTELLIDEEVTKVVAEAENGSFCLLPRHVDFVAAIIPGILSYTSNNNDERFVAVGAGVLVKSGPLVRVSAQDAVRGSDLGMLRQTVAERFLVLNDREKVARSAIAKLEADFVRRFLKFGEPRGD